MAILSALLVLTGCSREETIPLKDGRTLRTWSTTYGTNHIAPGQFIPWLDKKLPPFPQRLLRAWFTNAAARIREVRSQDSGLVLWTHPISGPTNTAAKTFVRLTFPGRIDAAGTLDYDDESWSEGHNRSLGVATLSLFRRRARTVTLEAQIIGDEIGDSPSPVAVLHLHNPQPFTGPHWRPEPLPISRTHSGIRATLYDLAVTNRFVTNNAGRRLASQQTWLHFEALDATQRPMRVLGCTLSDPGGNQLFFRIAKVLEKPTAHRLGGALFDDEPAWRLQVETDLPDSDPTVTVERMEFTGLTDAAHAEKTDSQPRPSSLRQTSRRIPNLDIRMLHFIAGNAPMVLMGLRGCPQGIRVELEKVVDESGRIWNARETSSVGGSRSDSTHGYSISFTNTFSVSANSLNLTFRIYRTAIFEFHPPARFSSVSPVP